MPADFSFVAYMQRKFEFALYFSELLTIGSDYFSQNWDLQYTYKMKSKFVTKEFLLEND
jgi:hypothetical protein